MFAKCFIDTWVESNVVEDLDPHLVDYDVRWCKGTHMTW